MEMWGHGNNEDATMTHKVEGLDFKDYISVHFVP